MAITSVKEHPESPTASIELGSHKFTRTFLVQTNAYTDGPATVIAAAGIPLLFSKYAFGTESHLYARLRTIDPKRVENNSLVWLVTCNYSTPEPYSREGGARQEVDGQHDDPTLAIPEVSCSMETKQVPIFGVFDPVNQVIGPLKNSAGEIFDPPPMKDSSTLVLTITRNENLASNHPATGIQFTDSVNSDVFWGANPGQVKCKSISASRENKQTSTGAIFSYLKVTYVFLFKNAGDSWDLQLLDHGSFYLDDPDASGTMKKIGFKSDDGQPIDGLLDGATGAKGGPAYFTVRPYDRLPFGSLGLPQNFSGVS